VDTEVTAAEETVTVKTEVMAVTEMEESVEETAVEIVTEETAKNEMV
jgi:hypothetical protein